MNSETAMIVQAWTSVGGVLATLFVGAAQCGLIWVGLKQMRAASESRDQQMDNQHRETMRALEALIERTGGRDQ